MPITTPPQIGPSPRARLREVLAGYGDRSVDRAYGMLHGARDGEAANFSRHAYTPAMLDRSNTPGYAAGISGIERAAGLRGIVPEVNLPPGSGASFFRPSDNRAYISAGATPLTRMHEQYHGTQGLRDQWWQRGGAELSPRDRLAAEMGPSLFSRLGDMHAMQSSGGLYPGGYPTDKEAAVWRDAVRINARANAPVVPMSSEWQAAPTGDVLPRSQMAIQAARYGAFGPTPLAKKLGFQGQHRVPIEQLLMTPAGRSWLEMYMRGNK